MNTHARIAPSKLRLTMACPASLTMQEQVQEPEESESSAEGSAAHYVAMMVASGQWGRKAIRDSFTYGGREWKTTAEMREGALLYAGEAQAHLDARFEEFITIPAIHPELCTGTSDYWRYIPEINTLKVIDYKFGYRYVEVYQNPQLYAYASGIACALQLSPEYRVKLTIVQPRCYGVEPVREHVTTVGEIHAFCTEQIVPKVTAALESGPPAITGLHCLDCSGRIACSAFHRRCAHLAEYAQSAQVNPVTPIALGAELIVLNEAQKILEGRYTALYAQAENMALNGTAIPRWHLEQIKGRLKWTVSSEQIEMLSTLTGIKLMKSPEPVTPTQAIAAGFDKEMIKQFAERPSGMQKLVPTDEMELKKLFDGAVT